MADVISVSSDDSDVEFIDSYNNVMTKADPLPLTAVRVDVDVVNANVPLVSPHVLLVVTVETSTLNKLLTKRLLLSSKV